MAKQSLFTRLNKIFSTSTVVTNIGGKRLRVLDIEKLQSVGGMETNFLVDRYNRLYKSNTAFGYNQSLNFQASRYELYRDYEGMDMDPILASALDIYSDESTVKNERGQVLRITSKNEKVQSTLENLFFDILNLEFNLWPWVRSLCKYGDFYLKLDISEKYGIINVHPMSQYEVVREDGFNPENPGETRFVLTGNTKYVSTSLEKIEYKIYEVAHFRLLGDSNFIPYGKSLVEPARKIWKQLTLMEDAMLIHRIMRAPEKRVFYVDVGNIPPNEIEGYMKQLIDKVRKIPYVDQATGDYNLKFNMMNIMEDFFLPTRGEGSGTKIDTTKGLEFNAIEDVEYLKHKLLAALKIPKAFLGYDEKVGGKATLAAEDVRFARTIERVQRIVASELYKMAYIHLYVQGFSHEDLVDFEIQLTNPSTIYEQEKLALWETRIKIATDLKEEKLHSTDWIFENIFNQSEDETEDERKKIVDDVKRAFRYKQIEDEGNDPVKTGRSFGTAHDLAALAIQQEERAEETQRPMKSMYDADGEKIKFGATNLRSTEKPGPTPMSPSYGSDDHINGRDPLGSKSYHKRGGMPSIINKNKQITLEEQSEKERKKNAAQDAIKKLPESMTKQRHIIEESIGTEKNEVTDEEKSEKFLDEKGIISDENLKKMRRT